MLARRDWLWPAYAALGACGLAVVVSLAGYWTSPLFAVGALAGVAGVGIILASPMTGIYAGVLCAPLEYLNLKVGGTFGLTVSEVVLLVTAVSLLLRALRGGLGVLSVTGAHAAFAALIAVVALGLAFAPDTLAVGKIVVMWSVFLLLSVSMLWASPEQLRRLLLAIAYSGAIVAVIALVSTGPIELRNGGETAINRAQASFAHPAILGFFLALALPCALCLGLTPATRWQRGPLLIAAVLMLSGLMLTLTRGAIVGAGVALVMLLWLPRFRAVAATLLVGVAIFSAANLNPILDSPQASIVTTRLSTIGGRELQTNPRIRIYRAAPAMVVDHPLVGIGAGNFSLVSPLYGPRDLGGDAFDHAHNVPLTIAIETGLIGLAAFLGFVAGLARAGLTVLRSRLGDEFPYAMAPLAALSGLAAMSMIDYPLRTNLIMAVIMLLAGALLAYARGTTKAADAWIR